MILGIFEDARSLIGSVATGNVPPKINSLAFVSLKAAAACCMAACILVTSRTYIGDNINCYSANMGDEEMAAVESYCFISSTFTLTNMTVPSSQPGVGPAPSRVFYPPGTEPLEELNPTQHHAYYQWVPFLLALQSVALYLPCALWDTREDGYFGQLLNGAHQVTVDRQQAEAKIRKSAKLFYHTLQRNNGRYLFWFFFCEVLGAVIAVSNLFVTNTFLGGRFLHFGREALDYLNSPVVDINNPLNMVFPKVGKCTWHSFGASGSIQTKDALCVLPLNIVNEKVYVVLWLAFIVCAALVCATLLFHAVFLAVPALLTSPLKRRAPTATADTSVVLQRCGRADVFLLLCLQRYVINFPAWLHDLADVIDSKTD